VVRVVLIASSPRSGTTRLVEAFDAFEKVVAVAEVFNPLGCFLHAHGAGFAEYLLGTGVPLEGDRERALVNWMRSDPLRAVGALIGYTESRGREILVFKIFPGQLSRFDVMRLIMRLRPVGLVLHRDPLATFISAAKAQETGAWLHQDTTNVRPRIDYGDYVRWHRVNQSFFNSVYTELVGFGCGRHVTTYEDLYGEGRDPETYLERLFAEEHMDAGDATARESRLSRQDRATRPEDKVANWAEFEEAAQASRGPAIDAPYEISFAPSEAIRAVAGGLVRAARGAARRRPPRSDARAAGEAKQRSVEGHP
jgi:hypothetical protein